MKIKIKPNLSYVKERNVAERIVKEMRKFAKQTMRHEIITASQLSLTMDIISGIINSTPLYKRMAICPNSFFNPGLHGGDWNLPDGVVNLPYIQRINSYLLSYKIIHLEEIEGSGKLIAKTSGRGQDGPELGDIIFYFKKEDFKDKGIVYARVEEKLHFDYRVTTLDGQEKIIPYQRVRIFVPVHPDLDERLESLDSQGVVLAKRLENAVKRINGSWK